MSYEAVTFDDVVLYFSAEEWESLEKWQKELYKDVMVDHYQALLSVGLIKVIPEIILKILMGEEPVVTQKSTARVTAQKALPPPEMSPSRPQSNARPRQTLESSQNNSSRTRMNLRHKKLNLPLEIFPRSTRQKVKEAHKKSNIQENILDTHTNPNVKMLPTIDKQIKMKKEKEDYLCVNCGKTFGLWSSLVRHTTTSSCVKLHSCSVCGASFVDQSQLLIHQKMHSDLKSYECSTCGKHFQHQSSLEAHSRSHTAERPFLCKVCNKGFKDPNNLHRHERIHSGEKPFRCASCGKCYNDPSVLLRHQKGYCPSKKGESMKSHPIRKEPTDLLLNCEARSDLPITCLLTPTAKVIESRQGEPQFSSDAKVPTMEELKNTSGTFQEIVSKHMNPIDTSGRRDSEYRPATEHGGNTYLSVKSPVPRTHVKNIVQSCASYLILILPSAQTSNTHPNTRTMIEENTVKDTDNRVNSNYDDHQNTTDNVIPERDKGISLFSNCGPHKVPSATNMAPHIFEVDDQTSNTYPNKRTSIEENTDNEMNSNSDDTTDSVIPERDKGISLFSNCGPHEVPAATNNNMAPHIFEIDDKTSNTYQNTRTSIEENTDYRMNSNCDNQQSTTNSVLRERDEDISLYSVCGPHQGPAAINTNTVARISEVVDQQYSLSVGQECQNKLLENITFENQPSEPPSGIECEANEQEVKQKITSFFQDVKTVEDIFGFVEDTNQESQIIGAAEVYDKIAQHSETKNAETLRNQEVGTPTRSQEPGSGNKQKTCNQCGEIYTYNCHRLISHSCHTKQEFFQCDCGQRFQHGFLLEQHQKTHSRHTCQECGKTFRYKDTLNLHLRTHMEGRPYPCTECGEAFKVASKLRRHLAIHSGEKAPQHAESKRKFNDPSSLNINGNQKVESKKKIQEPGSDNKQRTCNKCGESYTYNRHRLISHRCHTKKELFQCKCGKSFQHGFQLEQHQKTHSDHTCQRCGKSFRYKAVLNFHLRTHMKGRPYPCTECGKAFKVAKKLRRHLKIHTGEKPSQCSEIGKEFNKPLSLNKKDNQKVEPKMRSQEPGADNKQRTCNQCGESYTYNCRRLISHRCNTERELFQCDCGESFQNSFQLEQHQKTHGGHTCQECGRTFRYKDILNLHLRTHTEVRPYLCTKCGKAFVKARRLQQHLETHTREKPSECAESGKRLNDLSPLNRNDNQKVEANTRSQEVGDDEKQKTCNQCGESCAYNCQHLIPPKCHTKKKLLQASCSQSVQNDFQLEHHQKTHSDHKCKECGRTFRFKAILNSHLRTHAEVRPYPCTKCGKAFVKARRLQRHLEIHTREKPSECAESGERLNDLSPLNRNDNQKVETETKNQEVGDDKEKTCNRCGKSYMYNCQHLISSRCHTKKKVFQCDCGQSFQNSFQLEQHRKTHSDHKCQKCGKAFKYKANLFLHLRTHKDGRPYPCTECGKAFKVASKLQQHLKSHTRENPFQQIEGEKRSPNPSSLNRLSNKKVESKTKSQEPGTDNKRMTCEHCGESYTYNCHRPISHKCHIRNKSFQSDFGQKQHQKTHSSHKCQERGRAFRSKANLTLHLPTHTKDKCHPCTECSKAFKKASKLQRHLKTHMEKKALQQRESGKKFLDPSSLNTHSNQIVEIKMKSQEPGSDNKQRTCDQCGESYTYSRHQLTSHKCHTIKKLFHCDSGQSLQPGLQKEELQKISNDHICQKCGRAFKSEANLLLHLPTHTKDRLHPCTECSKAFKKASKLQRHLKTHMEKKSFQQRESGKKFLDPSSLNTHSNQKVEIKMKSQEPGTDSKQRTCDQCGESYTYSCRQFISHKCHAKKKLFHCDSGQNLQPGLQKEQHQKTCSDHKCQKCERTFKSEANLLLHLPTHTQNRFYPCTECTKVFKKSSKLRRHLETHMGEKPFQQSKSEKRFNDLLSLKTHSNQEVEAKMRSQEPGADNKQKTCNQCGQSYTYNCHRFIPHRCHTKKNVFQCFCGQSFDHGFQLEQHQKTHSGYNCHKCWKVFKCKANLLLHLRTHMKDRPYPCTKCGKAFMEASKLRRHLTIHSGEKP